jgi:sarcosine oxidase delta subunit
MSAPTFAQNLTGMRVSASGILLRKENNKGLKFMRSELHKHLQTLAEHYYAGSQTIVDEFLQLYCLGEEHRKAAKEKAKKEALK